MGEFKDYKEFRDERCLKNLYFPPNSSETLKRMEDRRLERQLFKKKK